ncbi:hypothetical protein [Nocardioides jensenii]|uniref:hypothetical protein n=1 Tax=Nocardioides jensenii TaxID=1843 RepID=UPI000B0FB7C3|nr:hypothetical protein [Nocardioides jensenii]
METDNFDGLEVSVVAVEPLDELFECHAIDLMMLHCSASPMRIGFKSPEVAILSYESRGRGGLSVERRTKSGMPLTLTSLYALKEAHG